MNKAIRQLLVPVVAAVGAGLAVAFLTGAVKFDWLTSATSKSPLISGDASTSGYLAVYLANGRVYFAKARNLDAAAATLTNVYSLRKADAAPAKSNQSDDGDQSEASIVAPAEGTDFELVRLVDQYPQPTDEVIVARSAILYWEELPDSSRVVKAIQAEADKK